MTKLNLRNENISYDDISELSLPFLWNFRFGKTTSSEVNSCLIPEDNKETLKTLPFCEGWEVRYFWPASDSFPIILPAFEPHMFDLRQYDFNVYKDLYLVTPNLENNVKIRNNEILLKKLNHHANGIDGFLRKIRKEITIKKDLNVLTHKDVRNILEETEILGKETTSSFELHYAAKESMVTILNILPAKIEFSKFHIKNKQYLSLCIESRHFEIVEHLKNSLNFISTPYSYVNFLKDIIK